MSISFDSPYQYQVSLTLDDTPLFFTRDDPPQSVSTSIGTQLLMNPWFTAH